MLHPGNGRMISVADLMPPEQFYRPIRTVGGVVTSAFVTASIFFACFVISSSLLPVAVLAGFMFARVASHRVAYSAAVEHNQSAVNLLNAGRIDEAAMIFEQLTKSERRTPAHAVYVFNRAVAFMLQGRPRRAYSLFNAVLRSRAFHVHGTRAYLPLLHLEIGTCLALMGELEASRRQRDIAAGMLKHGEFGRLTFLDAMLLCSAGEYAATVELVESQAHLAEEQLRRPTMKAARLVHAYATLKLGYREEANRLVRELAIERGELNWFVAAWPELRALPI